MCSDSCDHLETSKAAQPHIFSVERKGFCRMLYHHVLTARFAWALLPASFVLGMLFMIAPAVSVYNGAICSMLFLSSTAP
jgi:hypothetical protein